MRYPQGPSTYKRISGSKGLKEWRNQQVKEPLSFWVKQEQQQPEQHGPVHGQNDKLKY